MQSENQLNLRPGTADNDLNATKSMGMLPDGAVVNHFLTDTDAFFIKTDAPNGFKMLNRSPIKTAMEGDFDTGNMRFKARERYSFGVSDWRCLGTPVPKNRAAFGRLCSTWNICANMIFLTALYWG